jgi:putative flavoprotein involved in K+ transport
MSTTRVETVVVGGGQAGLSVSYYLTRQGQEHVVLEQADAPANAWRNHRWDSFTLNTPNWQSQLPGAEHRGVDPNGFMTRAEIVAYFEDYVRRFHLPVRCRTLVNRVERDPVRGDYHVTTIDGDEIVARNVVMATGLHQTPKIPAISIEFPAHVRQIHSDGYRNPQELLPGAVLVVGSAQSGAQIAEELNEAGRKVFLAVSSAGRMPRRYRGKDANFWSDRLGLYDRTVDALPSPKAKFAGKPHISGVRGGHTINLHQFARDGVVLLGHLRDVRDGRIVLAPDLHDSLAKADKLEADFVKAVDTYIAETGIAAPQETLPSLRDGFLQPLITELDIEIANITNVIWATGYRFDFSLVNLPIFDDDGYPIQTRGVTSYEGLFFIGLPWLHNGKSGLIYGVGDDAAYVAQKIAGGMRRSLRTQSRTRSATASCFGGSRNGRKRLSVPPHSGFAAMSVSRPASTIGTAISN